jgi:hypothetical protein
MKKLIKIIFDFLRYQQWFIISIIGIVSFIVGSVGFMIESGYKSSLLNSFYCSVQLFIFQIDFSSRNVNIFLEISRWTAPFTLAFATVRTILIVAEEEISLLKLKSLNKHIIICGLGKKGFRIAKGLAREKVVIIEPNPNNEFIQVCKEMGMIVLIGNATHKHMLEKVKVKKAKYLFAVTDKDDINIAIAIKSYEIKTESDNLLKNIKSDKSPANDRAPQNISKMLRCYVHIGNLKLQSLFKQHYLFKIHDDNFESIIFNIYDICATETVFNFIEKNYHLTTCINYPPLHVLIVGFGSMGESLLLELAKMCHFSNDKKIKVTILDKKAKKREAQFKLEFLFHEQLDELIDINFVPFDAKMINDKDILSIQGDIPFNAIFICAGDEASRIFVSLNLNKLLPDVPIRIFLPEKSGITPLFETGRLFSKTQNIEVYNMAEKAYVVEKIIREKLEELAKLIHDNFIEREKSKNNLFSDSEYYAKHDWLGLPEEDKELNISAGLQIPIKLGIIGYDSFKICGSDHFKFTDEEITILSKIGHKQWMAERLLSGWTYGPNKDNEEKQHPDLLRWNDLSEKSKEKQRDFVRSIPEILKSYTTNQLYDIFHIMIIEEKG